MLLGLDVADVKVVLLCDLAFTFDPFFLSLCLLLLKQLSFTFSFFKALLLQLGRQLSLLLGFGFRQPLSFFSSGLLRSFLSLTFFFFLS